MNSWTDIGLIVAIVIGLISAASLPMISANAVSPESLRLQQASTRNEPLPAVENTDPLADYDDQLGMSELMELFDKTKQTIRAWLGNNTLPGYKVAGQWTAYKSELRDTLALTSNQRTADE